VAKSTLGRLSTGVARCALRGFLLLALLEVAALSLILLSRWIGPSLSPPMLLTLSAVPLAILLGLLTSRRVLDGFRLQTTRAEEREIEHKVSIQKVREDRYRLAGTLETLPFDVLVQALRASWQTGVLLVEVEGKIGKVYFEEGQVTEAEFGVDAAEPAFDVLSAQSGGSFLFQPGKQAVRKRLDHDVFKLLTSATRRVQGVDASVQRCVGDTSRRVSRGSLGSK
jgi:uncharacterized protein DUF4388